MSKKEGWLSRIFSGGAHTETETVQSPLSGRVIPIEEVADPTFAGKILGDGLAIVPAEGKLYAPLDAVVVNVMDTGHAVALESKALHAELLIHVGRDTVSLNGEHFTVHVKDGDEVKQGQLLLEFEPEAIAARGFDLTTPVIVCNAGELKLEKTAAGEIRHGDALLTLSPKE